MFLTCTNEYLIVELFQVYGQRNHAAGMAQTTLNVGSTPGLINVKAQCGDLSALTSVVAGAAQAVGLPATGDGSMASSGGSFPWLVALATGVVLGLAAVGVRRVGSRRSS